MEQKEDCRKEGSGCSEHSGKLVNTGPRIQEELGQVSGYVVSVRGDSHSYRKGHAF